jgi:hypothetical protein
VTTRRAFIGTVTLGILTVPVASEAQAPAKVPRIGFLSVSLSTDLARR